MVNILHFGRHWGREVWDKEDNVYTLRDSEVVTEDCYHVAMASNSTDWAVGFVATLATCIPIRNHVAKACLSVSSVGYTFLV